MLGGGWNWGAGCMEHIKNLSVEAREVLGYSEQEWRAIGQGVIQPGMPTSVRG